MQPLANHSLMSHTNPASIKRILHLGVGAFHRAHQAWYLNRLIDSGETKWTLAAGNIRPDMVQLLSDLHSQGGEYTLETVTPAGIFSYERIRSISDILPWTPDLHAVVTMGRHPDTRIISFTVTEAGYYLNQHQQLDLSYADLRSDLEQGTQLTIYGAICSILRARREEDAGPITLLCCDNIRSNGDHFRTGLFDFLERRGESELRNWAQDNTTCPNGMVDRITPKPPVETKGRVKAATGFPDQCAVMAEDFCQWVVEDHFCNGRPPWEKVGVEMVSSVLPYEEAKIRILNASHSCIAWAGALKGFDTIHAALADKTIAQMAFDYVTNDVIPCLSPSIIDLALYRDTVLDRFSNPHINDTIERVAADGFAKIPGFIAPTIAERLAQNQPFDSTATLPALFLIFLQQRAEGRVAFPYKDQAMGEAIVTNILNATDCVQAFCSNALLWGPIAGDPTLEATVRRAYLSIKGNL
ncbi:mannitol dehydrogenase family protein [Glaciimonas sp. Gout2]|uniref:D-arabinitol 4-dehydrogenase n=1 Tax=unclassified Glaciimonas TaxID=2644401 RepID=UPI002AB4C68E|nr:MULTISPECIES: D-arabinitol 4-dehydrogenase [unclassified Glaciimonas]MDY7548155.1 mannitol dehydrogenase family protein [Glaciimonas sp. CA11.2]MEB0014505.1 mannitol dehydrogenase family protein [Glaciimonas sp. Cout2]MEB0084759.1 mannitol dehydrogenase family protein [Glaciimonas sp. Gout2]